MVVQSGSFKKQQQNHERVKNAYSEKEEVIKGYFTESSIKKEGFNLFLRAFKKEMKLEVWVKEKDKHAYVLLHTYTICSSSGTLGPKRKEGDLQVPEGAYTINHFNPVSNFHLSLGINYPNASDKILSDKKLPGGAIYVHGNCVTIGCIPLTDDKIKELYVLAVEAKNNGQSKIPIHIFPAKLNAVNLSTLVKDFPHHTSFWKNLQGVYQDFETTKELKVVKVNGKGEYY